MHYHPSSRRKPGSHRMIPAFAGMAVVLFFFSPAAQAREMTDMNVAVLRTIDKISARADTYEIPVDKTVKFGKSLFIKARACRKSSPLDRPEEAAFLQIWERAPEEEKSRWVFSGWMFASTPSVSAMEHPVYDVWVIACKNKATSAKSAESFTSESAPSTAPEEEAAIAETPASPASAASPGLLPPLPGAPSEGVVPGDELDIAPSFEVEDTGD